jgi:hypothetical protein
MLARKKSLRFINNKFTLNQRILALLSLMRKITQIQKNGKKYFKSCLLNKRKYGAVVESQTGNPEIAGSSPTCAV